VAGWLLIGIGQLYLHACPLSALAGSLLADSSELLALRLLVSSLGSIVDCQYI